MIKFERGYYEQFKQKTSFEADTLYFNVDGSIFLCTDDAINITYDKALSTGKIHKLTESNTYNLNKVEAIVGSKTDDEFIRDYSYEDLSGNIIKYQKGDMVYLNSYMYFSLVDDNTENLFEKVSTGETLENWERMSFYKLLRKLLGVESKNKYTTFELNLLSYTDDALVSLPGVEVTVKRMGVEQGKVKSDDNGVILFRDVYTGKDDGTDASVNYTFEFPSMVGYISPEPLSFDVNVSGVYRGESEYFYLGTRSIGYYAVTNYGNKIKYPTSYNNYINGGFSRSGEEPIALEYVYKDSDGTQRRMAFALDKNKGVHFGSNFKFSGTTFDSKTEATGNYIRFKDSKGQVTIATAGATASQTNSLQKVFGGENTTRSICECWDKMKYSNKTNSTYLLNVVRAGENKLTLEDGTEITPYIPSIGEFCVVRNNQTKINEYIQELSGKNNGDYGYLNFVYRSGTATKQRWWTSNMGKYTSWDKMVFVDVMLYNSSGSTTKTGSFELYPNDVVYGGSNWNCLFLYNIPNPSYY